MNVKHAILLLSSAGLMSGCLNLNYPQSTVSGKFAAQNFDAQVVDPEPAEGAPEMDADMVDAAVERYKNDEVKEPFDEGEAASINLSFSPSE